MSPAPVCQCYFQWYSATAEDMHNGCTSICLCLKSQRIHLRIKQDSSFKPAVSHCCCKQSVVAPMMPKDLQELLPAPWCSTAWSHMLELALAISLPLLTSVLCYWTPVWFLQLAGGAWGTASKTREALGTAGADCCVTFRNHGTHWNWKSHYMWTKSESALSVDKIQW